MSNTSVDEAVCYMNRTLYLVLFSFKVTNRVKWALELLLSNIRQQLQNTKKTEMFINPIQVFHY